MQSISTDNAATGSHVHRQQNCTSDQNMSAESITSMSERVYGLFVTMSFMLHRRSDPKMRFCWAFEQRLSTGSLKRMCVPKPCQSMYGASRIEALSG